jgi:hypothetical protein
MPFYCTPFAAGIAQWRDVFEREAFGFTFKNIPKITNALLQALRELCS